MIKKVTISPNNSAKAIAFFENLNKKKDDLKAKIEANLADFKKELGSKKAHA